MVMTTKLNEQSDCVKRDVTVASPTHPGVLCSICQSIDFEALWSPNRLDDATRIAKSRRLGLLLEIAERAQGCTFCQWLKENIALLPSTSQSESGSSQRVFNLTVYGSTMYNGIEQRREGVSGYLIPIVELTCANGDDAAVTNLAQIRLVDYITEDEYDEEGISFVDGRSTTIQQFRHWLKDCSKNHPCGASSSGEDTKGPILLIDTTKHEIVQASPHAQYLALSYVWGPGARHDYVVNDRLSEILPQTLQDAIAFTVGLGYQYLWVDAICIPQDDAVVKLEQIQRMDEIYEKAIATLIATSPGVDHGLYTMSRNNQSCRSLRVGNRLIEFQPLPWKVLATTHGQVHSSFAPWSTRAWTFQEALISRRKLIFLEDRIMYECEDNSRQTHPTDRHEQNKLVFFNEMKTVRAPAMRDWNMHWYECMLNAYLKRNISFEQDILSAFYGVARVVSRVDQPTSSSCWGIPRKDFLSALMWAPPPSAKSTKQRTVNLIDGRSIPSWHWSFLRLPVGIAFCQGSEPLQMYSRARGDFTHRWNRNQWEQVEHSGFIPFEGQVIGFDNPATDLDYSNVQQLPQPELTTRLSAESFWTSRRGTFITCDAWTFASTNMPVREPSTVYPYVTRLGNPAPMKENKIFALLVSEGPAGEAASRLASTPKMQGLLESLRWLEVGGGSGKVDKDSKRFVKREGWIVVDLVEWESQQPQTFAGMLG